MVTSPPDPPPPTALEDGGGGGQGQVQLRHDGVVGRAVEVGEAGVGLQAEVVLGVGAEEGAVRRGGLVPARQRWGGRIHGQADQTQNQTGTEN